MILRLAASQCATAVVRCKLTSALKFDLCLSQFRMVCFFV
jgi:hypothetical protein